MVQPSEAMAAILCVCVCGGGGGGCDRPENINLVEDVEILLPDKFRWIPFSGFREEVENVKS